jgi:phosphoserine aminotransferase
MNVTDVTTERIYNFSAGPAILPEPVLRQAQRDLFSLPGVGMSVLELSHRGKVFEGILEKTQQDLAALLGIPSNYKILFLQGGASMQFSMIAMNFLPRTGSADYINTGEWSKKAIKEAKRVGTVHVAGTSEETNFDRIPSQQELSFSSGAAYVHYTSNNTIFGTELSYVPSVGRHHLVCDMSSDILSGPIDVSRFSLIYAGTQKNMGPAGATCCIICDDFLETAAEGLHTMLDYKVMASNNSLYNTPPCFTIYMVGLVAKYLLDEGGLTVMAERNRKKAAVIYDAIDSSDGFYRGHARPDSRSRMNITFRLPSEELEKRFVAESESAGFSGLKGHRSVGGLRASVYNAFPLAGCEALAQFMDGFRRGA